ncbi:MAG: hypothetical protein E6G29_12370 [Actinobacteria bacterium]|nr:MAG: hypothetical protein E6G29_12370 [Actinomycetota bacterium]
MRVEPVEVMPRYELVHLIHVGAAIVGSVLLTVTPLVGTIVLLATATSLFADLIGGVHLARRLTPRRASQNVVSPEDGGKPGTLVLVAHYDAARTGAPFGRRTSELRARIGHRIRRPIGLLEPVFWSVIVLLACGGLRLIGVHPGPVVLVQFIATAILIVSVPLLADIAFSGPVPGANDNASGVATVLRLAERYGEDLEYFDLWVLFTAASSTRRGRRSSASTRWGSGPSATSPRRASRSPTPTTGACSSCAGRSRTRTRRTGATASGRLCRAA